MTKRLFLLVLLVLCLSVIVYADPVDSFGDVVLKPTMTDQDVVYLKLSLMILGYYDTTALDPQYDTNIENAVESYQKTKGLDADGVFGTKTFNALTLDQGLPFINATVLKVGDQNHDVLVLKAILRSLNYLQAKATDNTFDTTTEEAVKAFQVAEQLDADGVVGETTLNRFVELKRLLVAAVYPSFGVMKAPKLEKGMVSEEVVMLQKVLAAEGCFTGAEFSTHYGDLTVAAVKTFQVKYGLGADGVAGATTLDKMASLGYIERAVVQTPVVSRSTARSGEYIAWNDAKGLMTKMKTILTIQDLVTGETFNVQVSYGHFHYDVEAATAQDAKTMLKIWGGKWSWERRAVLVHLNGRVLAASMNGMPHAGLDNQKEGITVSGRSAGFGKGYNYDSIKGNLMDGHVCLHFKDSKGHGSGAIDPKHQVMVKKAAGL